MRVSAREQHERKVIGAPGGKSRDDTYLLPAIGADGRALGTCLRNDDGSLVRGTEAPVVAQPPSKPR